MIEQIAPYFGPAYNLSVNTIPELGIVQDTPVVLDGIHMDDNYESDFKDERLIMNTLQFTVKTNLFGPVSSGGVIKVSTANVYQNLQGVIGEKYVASVNPLTANKTDIYTIDEMWSDISPTAVIETPNIAFGTRENSIYISYMANPHFQVFNALQNDSINSIEIDVTTIFNGASPTLQIGTHDIPDKYVQIRNVDLTRLALYQVDCDINISNDETLYCSLDTNGSTTGAATVTINYNTTCGVI